MKNFITTILVLTFALISTVSFAEDQKVRVGVTEVTAFSMQQGDRWVGFDIEYLNPLADELNWDVEYVQYPDLPSKLKAVESGEVDLALGGISITSKRESTLDFSVPTFDSKLSILVYKSAGSVSAFKTYAMAAFDKTLWLSIGIFVAFILFGSLLLWASDRKNDEGISSKFIPGYFQAIWCSFATATTIGYGDIAPKTWLSRAVTVPIALSGFIVLGSLMSSLTSATNKQVFLPEVASVKQMHNKVVGVKKGTTSVDAVREYGGTPLEFSSVEASFDLLRSGEISAFIGDHPSLVYCARLEDPERLVVVGDGFAPQYYGFAFPEGSELIEDFNRVHLASKEDGTYDEIYSRYFGNQ